MAPEPTFEEFYRGAEFGDYLEAFAERFSLRAHIRFGVDLQHFERTDDGWRLQFLEDGEEKQLTFGALFLCTGLANQRIPIRSASVPVADDIASALLNDREAIRGATVVVVGGGESAADIANHLAKPHFNNRVFLSLRSGIRVSPRYHPIRGVPSDFLRNRLLLSFRKGPRNWVGERFVTFRIRFDRLLAKWFPHQSTNVEPDAQARSLRREWDLKLKARAKGGLFNVFHNKSDDFLEAVAEKRLAIVGPPTDTRWNEFYDFEQSTTMSIAPDILVPSTGYYSQLSEFSGGAIRLKDFYHGCIYVGDDKQSEAADSPTNLFLIGFARPIIGNIPSISEMQSRYAVGVLAGRYPLPSGLRQKQEIAWQAQVNEYRSIDVENVYPVEQYPYCDILAKEMDILPTLANTRSLRTWLKIMMIPASTTHYVDEYFDAQGIREQKIYTPPILIVLLCLLRLAGNLVRLLTRRN